MKKEKGNGFSSTSISSILVERVDRLFVKAGFNTRAGYIHDRLRRAVERDESRFGGEDGAGQG